MLKVRRAKKFDVVNINAVLASYGYQAIDESYINPRDIALVAVDSGKIIGFLWIGLMRQNKQGYIDCFAVSGAYSGKGVGNLLAKAALEACRKLNVSEVFGIIANGEFHDRSAINALKMALASDGLSYTQVRGSIPHMIAEINGRT